jgi:hypothetical protein
VLGHQGAPDAIFGAHKYTLENIQISLINEFWSCEYTKFDQESLFTSLQNDDVPCGVYVLFVGSIKMPLFLAMGLISIWLSQYKAMRTIWHCECVIVEARTDNPLRFGCWLLKCCGISILFLFVKPHFRPLRHQVFESSAAAPYGGKN